MHKYNFENATEKRQADKELGHILMPYPDGQVKHPEHLQQHETLQVLQRYALNGNERDDSRTSRASTKGYYKNVKRCCQRTWKRNRVRRLELEDT